MNVKRYIAPNIQEAMIKIKNELGNDAMIIHTRKIRQKGIKGLFRKSLIEVVAAIEPVNKTTARENFSSETVKRTLPEPVKNDERIDDLQSEISEIKELLKAAAKSKVVNIPNTQNVKQASIVDISASEDKTSSANLEDDIRDILKNIEINDLVIDKILTVVKRQISITNNNEQVVKSAVRQAIKEYIGDPFTIDHFMGNQRVFLFVGPTGVGKTTTLAKLAARLSLIENKKVAFVTADTYRIAAVEQLKTYSEILGIPLSVVYEPEELSDVLYKYKDKDIILLDTAGRSHKTENLEEDLQSLVKNIANPEVFLVISLTTGYKDIKSILKAYDFVDNYKLIFTKLDEANSYSNILNIKEESGKTLSYVTTGQSVPDDIEVADAERITNYIVGEVI